MQGRAMTYQQVGEPTAECRRTLDLSTGQLSRRIMTGIGLSRCRFGRKDVHFDRELGLSIFTPFLEKELSTFFPRVRTYPFSMPSLFSSLSRKEYQLSRIVSESDKEPQ